MRVIATSVVSRILFDQNVPRALGRLLTGHHVDTAAELGWGELVNGALLKAAEAADFDLIITCDQNIRYQQNMMGRAVGLIVLSTNHWATLRPRVDRIALAIAALEPNGYAYVDCGLTPKRRSRRWTREGR